MSVSASIHDVLYYENYKMPPCVLWFFVNCKHFMWFEALTSVCAYRPQQGQLYNAHDASELWWLYWQVLELALAGAIVVASCTMFHAPLLFLPARMECCQQCNKFWSLKNDLGKRGRTKARVFDLIMYGASFCFAIWLYCLRVVVVVVVG